MSISTKEYNLLVDQNGSDLLSYARLMFRGNSGIAEDIVQSTFLYVWKNRENIEMQNPRGYLFRVCRNMGIDYQRKYKKEDSLGFPIDHLIDDKDSNQDIWIKEIIEVMHECSTEEIEILLLKLRMGMTYKEISHVLSISSSNVGVILHRLITKIKKKMKGESL